MNFSQVLREEMQRQGMTQYRLAKTLEVSQSSIANWLSGATVPHKATMRRLANALSVSVEYLETGKKITPTDVGEREELLAIHDGLPEEFRLVLLEQARSLAKALRSADSQQ